jgi:Holliday junction resolvase RusA-like endonuclease
MAVRAAMTTSSEPALFCRLLKVIRGALTGALLHVFIDAEPKPASRPRISRFGGVYYAKGYEQFYAECQRQLATAKAEMLDNGIVVAMEFVIPRAKTSKLTRPKGDVDNYVKGPLDAMTKVEKFWRDDSQVETLVVTKRFPAPGEQPGVHIHYGPTH